MGNCLIERNAEIHLFITNSYHWRAKSLDCPERCSSSTNICSNAVKHSCQQSAFRNKPSLKDFGKPLTIHIDYDINSSCSTTSRGFRTISSSQSSTPFSKGARDTPMSLHVPSSSVMKTNSVLSHGQRRLSKRYSANNMIIYKGVKTKLISFESFKTLLIDIYNLKVVIRFGNTCSRMPPKATQQSTFTFF